MIFYHMAIPDLSERLKNKRDKTKVKRQKLKEFSYSEGQSPETIGLNMVRLAF